MDLEKYIDIHCHILPEVDDGAESQDQAMEMIGYAREHGTRIIIATPHYGTRRRYASRNEMADQYYALRERLHEEYPEMRLFLGEELSYHEGLGEELRKGRALTLAKSRYALVEFHPGDEFGRIRNGLQKIQIAGYWPILAHVERCEKLLDRMDHIEELLNMGVYLQVNASSVTGKNGRACKKFVHKLLKGECVDFVASDGHDPERRKPAIQKAIQWIEKNCSVEYAMQIARRNPGNVIKNIKL